MAVEVSIDGAETPTVKGSVTPRLNRPSQGQIVVPMHLSSGGAGSKIRVDIDGVMALHGRATYVETVADEDQGYTTYNITDPLELWDKRPVRDDDGDFSNPDIIERMQTAPQIIEEALKNSIGDSEAQGNPAISPPTDAEGPMDILLGTFDVGGVSVEGAPTDWPMTIAELAALLVSTGQLDILAVPIDTGGHMARIDCYNGNYGTDLSGSVSFDFGMGAYNVRQVKWTQDLSTTINKLWTYLGPRVATELDPGSVQHWRANITGTSPLPDPPLTAVLARRAASQAAYMVRMLIQIYDAQGTESGVGKELYEWNWLAESWAAAMPRDLLHITPKRGLTYGTFGVGDLVRVRAAAALRGGYDAVQRIYEYTASWEADESVLTIGELQTSADNEGFA